MYIYCLSQSTATVSLLHVTVNTVTMFTLVFEGGNMYSRSEIARVFRSTIYVAAKVTSDNRVAVGIHTTVVIGAK